MPSNSTLFKFNSRAQRFESGTLGAVSCDDQRSVWQAHHGAQKLIDAFLRREPAEVEDVSFVSGEVFIAGQCLEVGQNFDALPRKAAADQLVAHEFAGSQEHVHAAFVSSQPFVQVCFGCKNHCARTRAGIATLRGGVVESALTAEFAGTPMGDKIVGGAHNLEIVQVVEHGDPLALQFPKNRGR
jgi:hypothetical protein